MALSEIKADTVSRALWIMLAVTFPFFGTSLLRYHIPFLRIELAIPMVILAVILAVALVSQIKTFTLVPSSRLGKAFAIFYILFIAWHVVGLARSEHIDWAEKLIIKLTFGALIFWLINDYFPRDAKFLKLFWKIVFVSSFLLVASFTYKYIFVFQGDFLGSDWFQATPSDKGHLAWYLMPIVLYSIFYFLEDSNKALFYPLVFIFITGWLYICSRGAWVSVLLGLISIMPIAGYKRFGKYLITILITLALSWVFLEFFVTENVLQFPRRLLWFVSPSSTPEFVTYEVRFSFLKRGIDGFLASPIFGLGIGDIDCLGHTEHIPLHNDFITILADQGIVGLVIFLAVFIVIGYKVLWKNYCMKPFSWLSLGGHATFISIISSFLYINVYSSPFLWLLLGLIWHETNIRSEN